MNKGALLQDIDELYRAQYAIKTQIFTKLEQLASANDGSDTVTISKALLLSLLEERTMLLHELGSKSDKSPLRPLINTLKKKKNNTNSANLSQCSLLSTGAGVQQGQSTNGGFQVPSSTVSSNASRASIGGASCLGGNSSSSSSSSSLVSSSPSKKAKKAKDKAHKHRFSIHFTELLSVMSLNMDFLVPEALDNLPKRNVMPLSRQKPLMSLRAPGFSSAIDQSFSDFFSMKVVSNYPLQVGRPFREGDPICDRLDFTLFENRAVAAIADGCNWGEPPRKAARTASKVATTYIMNHQDEISSVRSAGIVILSAFEEAHKAILAISPNGDEPIGSTTMAAGVLLELVDPEKDGQSSPNSSPTPSSFLPQPPSGSQSEWVFVFASVGDCKVLHFDHSRNKVIDITKGNRGESRSVTDPGGRIGACEKPDLRNFQLYTVICSENDQILMMSDGVHDNLDPEHMGLMPQDIQVNANSWEDLDPNTYSDVKSKFMSRWIEMNVVHRIPPGRVLSPKYFVQRLIEHSQRITASSREFMQKNPISKLPTDHKLYPGKMDHASCLCFRVGRAFISYETWMDFLRSTQTRRESLLSNLENFQSAVPLTISDRPIAMASPVVNNTETVKNEIIVVEDNRQSAKIDEAEVKKINVVLGPDGQLGYQVLGSSGDSAKSSVDLSPESGLFEDSPPSSGSSSSSSSASSSASSSPYSSVSFGSSPLSETQQRSDKTDRKGKDAPSWRPAKISFAKATDSKYYSTSTPNLHLLLQPTNLIPITPSSPVSESKHPHPDPQKQPKETEERE